MGSACESCQLIRPLAWRVMHLASPHSCPLKTLQKCEIALEKLKNDMAVVSGALWPDGVPRAAGISGKVRAHLLSDSEPQAGRNLHSPGWAERAHHSTWGPCPKTSSRSACCGWSGNGRDLPSPLGCGLSLKLPPLAQPWVGDLGRMCPGLAISLQGLEVVGKPWEVWL